MSETVIAYIFIIVCIIFPFIIVFGKRDCNCTDQDIIDFLEEAEREEKEAAEKKTD